MIDQQTYDRLNAIEKGIEALWSSIDGQRTANELAITVIRAELAIITRVIKPAVAGKKKKPTNGRRKNTVPNKQQK